MDGPAFWKENDCLEYLRNKKRYFMFDLGDETVDTMLTTIANLIAFIKNNWSKREREIIDLYEKFRKQDNVAKKYNISQQAVSNALKRAQWQIVRESEGTILRVLRTYPQ